METTFMTIHNLTPDANILYASDSIVDILGYHPEDVINRSCFDYFHPQEVPFARKIHGRGVRMDKAAVLHYARIQNRDQEWVSCECVFSVVHDVLVACTSIYRGDEKNQRRAEAAPTVRRKFAASPKDPRYHMLEHLSSKFRAPAQPALNEPRAALILNRFTRTLTVMYATNAVESILGISAEQLKDKSFYECIRENCLPDAIRCLESAKANDSIAYLRFWYRNPRRAEEIADEQAIRDASQSSDSEDGGVELHDRMDVDVKPAGEGSVSAQAGSSSAQGGTPAHVSISSSSGQETSGDDQPIHSSASPPINRSYNSSGASSSGHNDRTVFDHPQSSRSSTSSIVTGSQSQREQRNQRANQPAPVADEYELEAVVSCTSDGLVVILRRARPVQPNFDEPNGVFAAPWGEHPIHPHVYQPNPQYPFEHGFDAPIVPPGAEVEAPLMAAIRDVAVFAWSLAGINGNIANYGHGNPVGEAVPVHGFPIWDPYGQPDPSYQPPYNQAAERWGQRDQKQAQHMGIHSRVPPQMGYEQHNYNQMSSQSNNGLANQQHAPQRSLGGGYVFQGPESYFLNGYATQYGPYPTGNNPGQSGPSGQSQYNLQNQYDQQNQQSQRDGQEQQPGGLVRDRYMWY